MSTDLCGSMQSMPERRKLLKKFICTVCEFIYEGDELPEDYECPLCGVGPDQFEEVKEEE